MVVVPGRMLGYSLAWVTMLTCVLATFPHNTTFAVIGMNLLKDYESDGELINNDGLRVVSSKRIPNTNWEIVMTSDDFEFYFDSKTNTTQWETPDLPDALCTLLQESPNRANQEAAKENADQDEINSRIQLLRESHIDQLDNHRKLLSYFELNKINPFSNWDDLIIDSPLSVTEQKLVFDEYCHSIAPLSTSLATTTLPAPSPKSQSTVTTLPTTSISQSTSRQSMESMERNFFALLSEIPGNKINKHTTWFDARRRLETMTPKDKRYTTLKSDKLRNRLFIQYQKQLN
jgi:hypothetical protein